MWWRELEKLDALILVLELDFALLDVYLGNNVLGIFCTVQLEFVCNVRQRDAGVG